MIKTFLIFLGIIFLSVTAIPSLLGYNPTVITTGSMTGTYDRGSLVFSKKVPSSTIEVGNVITYQPPVGQTLVTHRVYSKTVTSKQTVFVTKGDRNASPDDWEFVLPSQAAQVKFGLPYVGFALALLSLPVVKGLAIALPCFLLALAMLAELTKLVRKEMVKTNE